MQNLLKDLKELLKQDERLVADGELLKNKVVELALQLDPSLIQLLLSHARLQEHFFVKIGDSLIFKERDFIKFVSNKEFLPDSYTSFANKIGLTVNGEYIKEQGHVVLAWPYRDCVLEGDMKKEDEDRDEIFYNEILAPDEIDRLLEAKVLTGFKRIDKTGEHKVKALNKSENIIMKGNNLLALHSLKKKYCGKIKLIYIDPPYNTGNDSFKYNDNFNHSTWLTFMKNRLEIAKDLLRDDGSIWINIDDNEIAYLKVLCDDWFGGDQHITTITVKRSAATGHKAINPAPVVVSDYVVAYSKTRKWQYKVQYTKRDYDSAYSLFISNHSDEFSNWRFVSVEEGLKQMRCKDIYELIKKYPERVVRFAEPSYEGVGSETRELIDRSRKNPKQIFRQRREGYPDIYLLNGQRLLFYKDKLKEIDGQIVTAEALTNIWLDIPFQGIAKEGGVVLKKGKKPEMLLRRILEISTNEGDLVLDFNLGSGTTCAVAHKMGRRYIGVEQLDYAENDSVVRLKNVIRGDPSGISKAVGWKGGGSFVYCELMKWNERFIQEIYKAKDKKQLESIWERMKQTAFLSYKVDVKAFDENAKEFSDLDIKLQKKFLLEVLDKNQLYVNLSEMDDETYGVSEEDKKLNRQFYSAD